MHRAEPAPEDVPERIVSIPPELVNVRLDKALRGRLPEFSRVYLRDLIKNGFVYVRGRVERKPSYLCEDGDELRVRLAPRRRDLGPPPPEFKVIHADASIIIISKPAGLAAHRNEGVRRGSVADYAQRDFGILPTLQSAMRPGIVHRLDKDTSGVMVLGRTTDALQSLKKQFAGRTVNKEYRAIVFGELRFDSEWIEKAIDRDPSRPSKMSVLEGGRESSTFVEVLERFPGFTYVRCLPKTGRTHQIRVHLSWLGHPIAGDRVYRSRKVQFTIPPGAPAVSRQLLHAISIEFDHPESGERVKYETPLSEDLEAFLRFLKGGG